MLRLCLTLVVGTDDACLATLYLNITSWSGWSKEAQVIASEMVDPSDACKT